MKSLKSTVVFFSTLVLFSSILPLKANEKDEWEEGVVIGESISYKWRRGRFLLYDCFGQYYACVDRVSFQRCERERKRSMENNLPVEFSRTCTPLKEMPTAKECFRFQQLLIDQVRAKTFCSEEKPTPLDGRQQVAPSW